MPRVKDEVDAFERLRHLRRRFRAGRWDVRIRYQPDLHDDPAPNDLFRMARQPGEPWLGNTFVIPEELESRLLGELLIEFAIANVEVFGCDKARPYVGQHVLGRHEIDLDVARFPERFLGRRKTIRTAADQKSQLLSSFDHLDGYPAGRITELERAVDVETDQECQLSFLRLGRFAVGPRTYFVPAELSPETPPRPGRRRSSARGRQKSRYRRFA